MSYGRKYTTSYKRRSGGTTTIDLLETGYSGAATTLIADANALEITTDGDAGNIFQSTIGSGAVLRVLTQPLSFISFTADPQLFMVKCYNGSSGTNLFWQGFISPEIFQEDYSTSQPVGISINCTDGIAVLNNIKYKATEELFYNGIQTLGTVISNVFSKIGLTFNYVYTNTDLQTAIDTTSLFTNLKISNLNFLDESLVPMSTRQVLDSIIGGLGLVLKIIGADIYLIDPLNLKDASKGKRYNAFTFAGETSVNLGGVVDISGTTLSWYQTGVNLDIQPAQNEVRVIYNPYNLTSTPYLFNTSSNWSAAGTFTNQNGYQLNTTVRYKDWLADDYMQVAMRKSEYSKAEYVLMFNDNGGTASIVVPNVLLQEDTNLQLKISADFYTMTKKANQNIFDAGQKTDINRFILPISVKIGNQYWKYNADWSTSETGKYQQMLIVGSEMEADYLSATINDSWVNANVTVPLWGATPKLNGDLTIEILDNLSSQFSNQIIPYEKPYFSTTTDAQTISIGNAGVTIIRTNDYTLRTTIVGFKTLLSIPANYKLFDNAITAIDGANVGGIYKDGANANHNFGSSENDTHFMVISYSSISDTLVFDTYTTGGNYFGSDFSSIFSCYLTNLTFTYGYLSGLLYMKNLKVEVIDNITRQVIQNNCKEETAVTNKNFTNKAAFEINTTSGTGVNGSSRGAYKNTGDVNISGLYRGAEILSTSKHILQSVLSQYKQPRLLLTGSLDVSNYMLGIHLKLIADNKYLSNKAFYIVSSTYNDCEESLQCQLLEIANDRDTITSI